MADGAAPAGASARPQGTWLRRLAGYCWLHPRDVVAAVGAAVVGMGVTALVPLVQRLIIDDVIITHHRRLLPWALLLVAMALVVFVATAVRRWRGGAVGLAVQHDLRTDVFAAVSRLDGAGQDDLDTGQLVGRTTSDLALVQGLLFITPNLIGSVLQFCVALAVMVWLSPLLTLVAVVTVPALFAISRASRRRLHPASWVAQQQAGAVAGVVESAVTGVRVVKGFGQEEQEVDRLAGASRRLFADRVRLIRLTSRYQPAMASVPALGQVGVLALGGWLAYRHSITLGTFLAFSTYLAQMVGPVRIVAMLLTVGQQARTSVERVLEVIDSRPVITETTDPVPLDAAALRDGRAADAGVPAVELADVTFGYVASSPVLHEVSLSVAPGEVVALVGASGSGKSTIAQLLPRLYDPQSGVVRVAGVDVRDAATADLRSVLGVVPEESFLFSESIAANIAYGRPDASRAQVEAAARAAQADAFVRALPDGYDTVVGERGTSLSGGQRQRVALARALVTDPAVLLLDDATSAVDARVEAQIHEALRSALRGRSTLLIAHRRSTLSLATRIVVLERGRVIASGSHEELVATSRRYRQLVAGEDLDRSTADWEATPERVGATRGADAVDELDAEAEEPGVTAALWDAERAASATARTRTAAAAGVPVAAGRPGGGMGMGGGAGGGGGGGMGGSMGAGPLTPELLAEIEALPPARDTPDIPEAVARAAEPRFSLRRVLGPVSAGLAAGLALMVLDAALGLALPLLVRLGVDDGVEHHALRAVVLAASVALAAVLLDWVVQGAGTRRVGRSGERVLYLLRVKLFAHLQRLGLDHYEQEMTGRILTRVTTDVDALSQFLQTGLTTALTGALTVVGIAVALAVMDPGLALVVAIVLPPLVVATVVFRRLSSRAYAEARERIGVVNADLQENVSGLRVAQVFRREGRNRERFAGRSDDYRRTRQRAQRYVAVYFALLQLLADIAAVLVLSAGSSRVAAGTLSVGALLAYLLYLDLFFSPVQQLAQVFDTAQQAVIALGRMRQLLATPTSTPEPEHPLAVPAHLAGEVVFDGVHFRYAATGPEALRGVDLRVAPGETVAFVGQTGAGKSTLVKLVSRMYDPTQGRVLVDGVDVRDYDLPGYRHRLGVVPQEAWLSPGTIADAIAYGRPGASRAEVEAAARAVGAHDVIAELPGGYLHPVGDRGRELSAGQRQLVALARAELVRPDVLLLDEATAALDLGTEAAVEAASDALASRRTTLVVAHRLTTAARADRVVVMDGGRVVEVGPHTELLARGGTYARLWEASTHAGGAGVLEEELTAS